jgi:uncharacterized protein YodC (DUF2158 family)
MTDQIKEGSVVQLKSGGPKMTVCRVHDENGTATVSCDWFVQDKKESADFRLSSLSLVIE